MKENTFSVHPFSFLPFDSVVGTFCKSNDDESQPRLRFRSRRKSGWRMPLVLQAVVLFVISFIAFVCYYRGNKAIGAFNLVRRLAEGGEEGEQPRGGDPAICQAVNSALGFGHGGGTGDTEPIPMLEPFFASAARERRRGEGKERRS